MKKTIVKKMINLLPLEEKNKLKMELAKNLTIILSGLVLFSLVCLILILISVRISVLSDASSQKLVFDQAQKSYQSQDSSDLKNYIKKYNGIMPQVLSFYQNQVYFSDILADISGISRPQGLYFDNISLDGQKYQDRIAISISGKSDTRDNLLLFKKNLEGQDTIKNVSFSPDSWINPANINFNVTFDFIKNAN